MTDSPHPLPQDVREALERRNLIEAIKLLRAQSGMGLKEAKDLVDRQAGAIAPASSGPVPESLPPSAAAALQQGNKVEAIRLLREQTGIGLKEAKELVDAKAERIFSKRAGLSPGEVPRSRGIVHWLVAAAIIAAVIVYFVLHRQI